MVEKSKNRSINFAVDGDWIQSASIFHAPSVWTIKDDAPYIENDSR